MKYVGYVLIVAALIHAIGSVVGHTPGKIVVSVLIGAVGAGLLFVSKKNADGAAKK